MASLFFRAHGDSRMRTCFQKISNQIHNSKITFRGMSGVDLKITTIRDSGISGYKSERFTGKTRFFLGWTCYTCENTSLFSRKSKVLHTFEVCAPTGVYKRKGGPRSSHHFAFSKILSTIYVYGDGNTTCVHTRNFIKNGIPIVNNTNAQSNSKKAFVLRKIESN